jgi:hypothetical protein
LRAAAAVSRCNRSSSADEALTKGFSAERPALICFVSARQFSSTASTAISFTTIRIPSRERSDRYGPDPSGRTGGKAHGRAIDKIIAADSRTSLTTACKVLDRVIRTGRYWVPHWYKASHWLAYWDVFGRPATKPRYARGIPETWWYDREKAAKIDQ